jgi:hypothetical protein
VNRTESLTTTAIPGLSSFSPTSAGALVHNSENPVGLGGDFTAHGRAEISNAYAANVLADVSSEFNATQTTFAAANNTNSVFSFNLLDAASLMAINGGSSIFTVELFIDMLKAEIELFTDGLGSTANAEYSLTASLIGFSGLNNTGSSTILGFASASDNQNAQDGSSVLSDTAAMGPSTAGGVGGTAFLSSFDIDANLIRSLKLDVSLTSSATATTPTPEPTSMALFGMGLVGFGASRIRRRRNAATAA